MLRDKAWIGRGIGRLSAASTKICRRRNILRCLAKKTRRAVSNGVDLRGNLLGVFKSWLYFITKRIHQGFRIKPLNCLTDQYPISPCGIETSPRRMRICFDRGSEMVDNEGCVSQSCFGEETKIMSHQRANISHFRKGMNQSDSIVHW